MMNQLWDKIMMNRLDKIMRNQLRDKIYVMMNQLQHKNNKKSDTGQNIIESEKEN